MPITHFEQVEFFLYHLSSNSIDRLTRKLPWDCGTFKWNVLSQILDVCMTFVLCLWTYFSWGERVIQIHSELELSSPTVHRLDQELVFSVSGWVSSRWFFPIWSSGLTEAHSPQVCLVLHPTHTPLGFPLTCENFVLHSGSRDTHLFWLEAIFPNSSKSCNILADTLHRLWFREVVVFHFHCK